MATVIETIEFPSSLNKLLKKANAGSAHASKLVKEETLIDLFSDMEERKSVGPTSELVAKKFRALKKKAVSLIGIELIGINSQRYHR